MATADPHPPNTPLIVSRPIVTEIRQRLEPVVHDTFIDDLGCERPPQERCGTRPPPRCRG